MLDHFNKFFQGMFSNLPVHLPVFSMAGSGHLESRVQSGSSQASWQRCPGNGPAPVCPTPERSPLWVSWWGREPRQASCVSSCTSRRWRTCRWHSYLPGIEWIWECRSTRLWASLESSWDSHWSSLRVQRGELHRCLGCWAGADSMLDVWWSRSLRAAVREECLYWSWMLSWRCQGLCPTRCRRGGGGSQTGRLEELPPLSIGKSSETESYIIKYGKLQLKVPYPCFWAVISWGSCWDFVKSDKGNH